MTVRYPPPGKIKREAEHRDATAVGKMAVMAKPESSSTSVVVISILRQNTARGVVGWGFRSPGQCMFFVAYDTVCLGKIKSANLKNDPLDTRIGHRAL
jgi:hypothetical protein